ncbi:hypothetical protein CASFOL_021291 [Castilleja foliolosa]|uniref:F-box domain-containing protein n=1 Tax=Castilleja foliolosa TaxID=1961234 RepID=A0ABD3CXP4_9LAMI
MDFPFSFPENLLRQPPHPHRRSTANEKAEEESNKGQQKGYYLRTYKRRKRSITNIESSSSSSSLPDDIWYEILAHLPAKDIYDLARLVCWKWYRTIYTHTFIYTNLQYTPYGLIFTSGDSRDRNKTPLLVTMQQGRIETSKLSDAFTYSLWNTCNGLIVFGVLKRNGIVYYIANPITEQVFVLPPTPAGTCVTRSCGIGYASVSMEYKVVVTTLIHNGPWAIITPGVDRSWRVLKTDHFGLLPLMVHGPPLTTEGFMHWTFDGPISNKKVGNQVLSLDVETEIVTQSCVPLDYDRDYDHWKYLSTGRYLTLLITYGDCSWEVWELDSGEWRKLDGVVVDLGTQMFEQFGFELVPVGWLKYLEVLVFRFFHLSDLYGVRVYNYLYNLLTKETTLLELPMESACCKPLVHKNSLVWLAGS